MAVNEQKYREFRDQGYSHQAALALADPATDFSPSGATVTDPPALTAPADIAAVYTEAEVQALRNDIAALRGTVVSLLASLRAVGHITP